MGCFKSADNRNFGAFFLADIAAVAEIHVDIELPQVMAYSGGTTAVEDMFFKFFPEPFE